MLKRFFTALLLLFFISCGNNSSDSKKEKTDEKISVSDSLKNDGKSQFSWDQISKLIESDKANNIRNFECTKEDWEKAIKNYNDTVIATLKTRKYATPELIEAMSIVPRPFFAYNYEKNESRMVQTNDFNVILDLGWGSTMSAPSIQGFMTANLSPKKDEVALEIGTGSGIQAAILSRLVKKVYSIEIREKLAERVNHTLKAVGYDNIETKTGDGYYGWEEKGPFDIIIVTCQANHIPPELIKQLKPTGRMVIPVGPAWSRNQQMLKVWKDPATGKVVSQRLLASTLFIPMLGANEGKKDNK